MLNLKGVLTIPQFVIFIKMHILQKTTIINKKTGKIEVSFYTTAKQQIMFWTYSASIEAATALSVNYALNFIKKNKNLPRFEEKETNL